MSVQLMAHRGNSALAPENTLAAFAKALDSRPEWIELDVHLSADGQVVVMHDRTVDRTTNGTGALAELTLAQIKALEAGSWFGAEFAGELVPTLAEVVELVGDRSRLNVEIKLAADNPGAPQQVVEVLRQGGVLAASMISSFDLEAVLEVRELTPEPALALITGRATDLDRAREAGLPWLNLHAAATTEALLQQAREAGIAVTVWTVDSPAQMEHFASLGVEALCTNAPHLWRF